MSLPALLHLPDGPALRVRANHRFRLPRVAGLVLAMLVGIDAEAGDILRGGVSGSPSSSSSSGKGAPAIGAAAADSARLNARDALARTSQALQSVKAMQTAARNAAARGGNNLGLNPNIPKATLPNVPNGLAVGGLKVAADGVWRGALTPQQSAAGGRTVVTVAQTKQQALMSWETFNVGKNTTVKFDQSAGGETRTQWTAVNKIKDVSGSPSQILGNLEADGQVFLINPNGILFGGTSQINLHSLVASSLPVNEGLLAQGVLNNPDAQFLFSAISIGAGAKGTPAFTPDPADTDDGAYGAVVVQPGAQLSSPTSSAGVGGRITLIGPRVENAGTISVPDGQAILAAGLQVGLAAHASSDPRVRGLDVFVGETTYPAEGTSCRTPLVVTGSVRNSGLIEAPRANVTIVGRGVNQSGVIASTTSVTLNGSVNLQALYDAKVFRPDTTGAAIFSPTASGTVTIGAGASVEILPELASAKTITGSKLPLASQVIIEGRNIHLENNATLLAPNADVKFLAGARLRKGDVFATIFSAGQIYLDAGALINVAGTTNVLVPIAQNILTLELRGAELADSPLQRTGPLRAVTLNLDLRQKGAFAGREWVGTPLGDARGFVGLIERSVGELTTAGGTVQFTAGNSVVMQRGAKIDVSGGSVQFEGGMVETTRVISGGQILDIAQATPDRVFQGIYDGTFTVMHPKYGLRETFTNPLLLSNARHEEGYVEGKNGGSITITAPSMALDGELLGHTVSGPRQRTLPTMAGPSALTLNFEAADPKLDNYPVFSPAPPAIVFGNAGALPAVAAFSVKANGNAAPLDLTRIEKVVFSPEIFSAGGFGSLTINNPDGDIGIPEGAIVRTPPGGSLTLRAGNLNIQGRVAARGGTLNFSVYDFTPYLDHAFAGVPQTLQPIDEKRGQFTLGAGAALTVAGLGVDDRPFAASPLTTPLVLDGGSISIASFNGKFAPGSTIDASGGYALSTTGKRTFGNGGSISLKIGQDPGFTSLIGGTLQLGAQLRALSGAKAGALTILAPSIQIGGVAADENTLVLAPEFFSTGGFGSFTLTGLGAALDKAGEFLPGIRVAAGTIVRPFAMNWDVLPFGENSAVQLVETTLPQSQRTPVSISLAASSVLGPANEVLVRGSVLFENGAVIESEPRAALSVSGDFVTIHGSLIAPGGTISLKGLSDSTKIESGTQTSLTTVHLGANAVLSTAGATVFTPNPYGYRTGSVLAGGKISVSGNIVAEAGALLDVSGASNTLDLPVAAVEMGGVLAGVSPVSPRSGVNAPLYTPSVASMRIDSDAGEIELKGGDHLFTDATLRGAAGGPSALGGALTVSSGNFFVNAEERDVLDVTLRVRQSGNTLPDGLVVKNGTSVGLAVRGAKGEALEGFGRFAADRFAEGGFDALTLKGTVDFRGVVSISARRTLSVADGGVLYANRATTLTAPYVSLGTPFLAPLAAEQMVDPFFRGASAVHFDPTFGPGKLTVIARLIDIGNLSLQGIGSANFLADGGDIRGDGTLDVAGEIRLRAAQIYPPSAVTFTIAASDYTAGGEAHSGSVIIENSGTRQLPLSAGGQLNIFASTIQQSGTLRAPLGGITLGWDGVGPGPRDPITGKAFASAKLITLAPGSLTSVSAIDPLSGAEMLLPYGLNVNGVQWIDPTGRDITAGGVVQKTIDIAGAEVRSQAGSRIDLRGGGDLYSFRWVPGVGGSKDVLASSGSFAILPGYSADFAPYAPFSASPLSDGIALNNTTGYVNSTLRVGDRIFLGESDGLAAGYYTLLPARYALLPGGHLVTPGSGTPVGSIEKPDGSALVPGYRFNDLNVSRTLHSPLATFEVLGGAEVRARSEFKEYSANEFLLARAQALETAEPRLPTDAGHLKLQALTAMTLQGEVAAQGARSGSHGGLVDIATPIDIVINANGGSQAGALVLSAAHLNTFGAESLLIGGTREVGTKGAAITVKSENITVDNAGAALQGPEIVIVANNELRVAAGARIQQVGNIAGGKAATLFLGDADVAGSGEGALLRVTSDANAGIVRAGLAPIGEPGMFIGAGAFISGESVTLDSTFSTDLNSGALLRGHTISLNSGQISVLLNVDGRLRSDGLILDGAVLDGLASAQRLSLLSYSTLDFYGTGTFATNGALALHAAQIRGFANDGGTVTLSAKSLLIDNAANVALSGTPGDTAGTLTLRADTINIGRNQLAIERFTNVRLEAANGLTVSGTGGLSVQQNLTATTPFVTAAQSATQSIKAGGALDIVAPASGTREVTGGLGASLTIEGGMVTVSSDIFLPSGALTLHATACDVTVNGRLNVDGTARTFYDLTRLTPGGQITLQSDTGSVMIGANSVISVSAPSAGGVLTINAPNGDFTSAGQFSGHGGAGGIAGSFSLDSGSLEEFAALEKSLLDGGFSQSQAFRVRFGDVELNDTVAVHNFQLTTDEGAITVRGSIDASGARGGTISLVASGSVTLLETARLSVAADDFDSAGKGGAITIETRGLDGGQLDLQAGSIINLSVASGNASSASFGRFSGTLHLRAPQNATGSDVAIEPIGSTINGASSIIVEGYKMFDLTDTNGVITVGKQKEVFDNGKTFLGVANGTASAGYTAMLDRLLGSNSTIGSVLSIRPGAEIINRDGNLTLGTSGSTYTSDWNLATFRFGPKSAPGLLTLRAAGNIVLFNSISDGFATNVITLENPADVKIGQIVTGGNLPGNTVVTAVNGSKITILSSGSAALPPGTKLEFNAISEPAITATAVENTISHAYDSPLLAGNTLLSANAQSWSYQFTAGADFAAADAARVRPLTSLGTAGGSLLLGKNGGLNTALTPGANATTVAAVGDKFQTIRTGSGDIAINAARDVQLLNAFATIYTAGTLVADPTKLPGGGAFDLPNRDRNLAVESVLGIRQQETFYRVQYTFGGGNVSINAGADIAHFTKNAGQLVPDSERELPNNWLYRRGNIDPLTGTFGAAFNGDIASTTWWVDFANFFEGVGALGGGNVMLTAGHDVANIDAVAPTNARMAKGVPDPRTLVELGGGDITIRAGHNIDAGVYYVERGRGVLSAGGEITTNSTRSPGRGVQADVLDPHTWLPTTLFVGKGSFDISARGDLLLGPVANPFLLPGGISNAYYYKTYFSTYAATNEINVTSLSGDVTLRNGITAPPFGDTPALAAWFQNELVFGATTSASQPWLRLNESNVAPFKTLMTVMPATLRATALAGDIQVVGTLNLSPSPTGTLELVAAGAIDGLNLTGVDLDQARNAVFAWSAGRINLSDANPASIPSIALPLGYQALFGTTASTATTNATFLASLDALFTESGSTQQALPEKQALHAPGLLHQGDAAPLRLYASSGDISGLTVFSPKVARVFAGHDLTDIALYIQNTNANDISVVIAGRDIIAYAANSPLRTLATAVGNQVGVLSTPLAGDLQISGPGTLEVLAGRDLDLGVGPAGNGVALGVVSVGSARNPFLPFGGADIIAGAGIGPATGLENSPLHFAEFIEKYIDGAKGDEGRFTLINEANGGTPVEFSSLSRGRQTQLALDLFYLLLREAGRDHGDPAKPGFGTYDGGFAAIKTLFGAGDFTGDISLTAREFKTQAGGNISLLAPGGKVIVGLDVAGTQALDQGILTESGGNIYIFADDSVSLGTSRIFTLRGGDEIIWSSNGDIAAGVASKTVQSAPPTRVLIDPQSSDLKTDLAGLATGGGIGVLATVEGVPPGNVDLIAPNGAIDAGDAGIRSAGNLNVAAQVLLNAENIQVTGSSAGTPTAAPAAAPNLGSIGAAASTAGAASTTASDAAKQATQQTTQPHPTEEPPSIITVEVLGYGGGNGA